ncbi:hypothetical protein [Hymenobacter nivis]|uniref:Uncharacterized protein n=1 Tax=Hymenobacter nivis TaxID=1850093 RepID=A0A502GVT8_9BACT|nr:hypothetical protein [Hymenobacter nivis]TPG66507.1 hypothetical protein EAH73_08860 [Hymenobacter nivis]
MSFSFKSLRTAALLAVAAAGTACHRGPSAAACGTPATVRDLSGLDGCGKVLELADGTRLLPAGPAWQGFAAADGQRVTIAYTPLAGVMTTCMAGKSVTITCIEAAR